MAGRLPFEPSVHRIFRDVLGTDVHVAGDPQALRARGIWPRVLRVTGLGPIQGGEVILVPLARLDIFLRHVDELSSAGIAGAIVAMPPNEIDMEVVVKSGVPLAVVSPSADMKVLQHEIEHYVIRRRRELFDLGQRFHHAFVERAISGSSARDIVTEVARVIDRTVILDRDGDIIGPSDDGRTGLSRDTLMNVRIQLQKLSSGDIYANLAEAVAAAPVLTGTERRGTLIVTGVSVETLDEDEVLLSYLAAACAIAISRESAPDLVPLDALLSSPDLSLRGGLTDEGDVWTCLAVQAAELGVGRVARALGAELAARDVVFQIGVKDEAVAALIQDAFPLQAEAVCQAVCARLGVPGLLAGLSRSHRGNRARDRAVREAIASIRRESASELIKYDDIELDEILAAVPDWRYFVTCRLGPLLEASRSGGSLLHTLDIYLKTGRNAVEAARCLHVHRNTLRYRLRAIEHLLDLDLDSPEHAFTLDLALRILNAHGGGLSPVAGSD